MSDDSSPSNSLETRLQILADETRIRIIDALAEATGSGENPISYSTLQSKVGVRDNGRLNYHLSKLAGEFITQTDAGYALLPAGRFAHLVAESLESETNDPVTMDASANCHYCGEKLVANYGRGHTFVVQCSACDRVYLSLIVPFARADVSSPSAFLDAMNETAHERFSLLTRGLCPWCRSPIETAVVDNPRLSDDRQPERTHLDICFRHQCTTCTATIQTTPGELLAVHPDVIAIHRRQGISLLEQYVWELEFAVTDRCVKVQSRDPLQIVLRTTIREVDIECVFDHNGDIQLVSDQSHLRGI